MVQRAASHLNSSHPRSCTNFPSIVLSSEPDAARLESARFSQSQQVRPVPPTKARGADIETLAAEMFNAVIESLLMFGNHIMFCNSILVRPTASRNGSPIPTFGLQLLLGHKLLWRIPSI
eukprot:6928620-Karenia_brevis.AAC.1